LKRVWAVFATVIGLGMGVTAASAATIDLQFTGKVTFADPTPSIPSPPPTIGDNVSFHLVYDTSAADTNANPGQGSYFGSITTLEATFSGQTHTFTPAQTLISVRNDSFGTDDVLFRYIPDNNAVLEFTLYFRDPTGTIFTDDSIPTDLISLQSIGTWGFTLAPPGAPPGLIYLFGGTSPSITVTAPVAATPVPAALPLLATALGGLGFAGWRRRRHAQQSQAVLEIAKA
jgi:hypothetical protein